MAYFPDDDDGRVLQDMAASGIDLSKPRAIDFMIDVKSESAGKRLTEDLARKGYSVQLEYDPGEPDFESGVDDEEDFGPSWTVYATVTIVPEYDELIARQKALNEIATRHGAKCDSWGTEN